MQLARFDFNGQAMKDDLPSQNRMNPALSGMNLWLVGLIVLLAGMTLVEGGIIISMRRQAAGDRQGLLSKFVPRCWMQPTGRAQRWATDDRIVLWESAQDIEAIHDQINRLFSALDDPRIPAHFSAAGHFPLRSPAMSARERLSQIQHNIDRIFEGSFDGTDIFSLPGRLEQGWNMSGVSSSMCVEDQASNMVVRIALPGVSKAAISINLQGRLLTVMANQGVDRQTNGSGMANGYSQRQRFETKLMLPCPVNAATAKASYQDDVLRIEFPKSAEKESLASSIKVI
jgi:HSP20 family molecular chaperone IbpA